MNPALTLNRDSIADSAEAPLHRFAHMAMNCDWEIFIAGEDAEYARQAAFAAWEEVDLIEAQLSRFWVDSDVARLNSAQPGDEVRIGPAALDCLLLAGEIGEQTQGAFDVMVGRAMDRIRAGQTAGLEFLPDEALLEIDTARGVVRILGEGMAIDFGALGKGYAVDRVLAVLREWSIANAFAHSASSSCVAMGTPPGCDGWPLGLRDPRDPDCEAVMGAILLRDAALGGSGFQTLGRHIIDPRSGLQVDGKLGSWAICASAARADGISTALMVMEPDEIGEFLAAHPADSGLVLYGDALQPQIVKSGAFAAVELDLNTFSPPVVSVSGPILPANAPPEAALADSLAHPFIGKRVSLNLRENNRQTGVLVAASEAWLQLQSDGGATILVPREALLWLEVQ